jgi:hypothetical protein
MTTPSINKNVHVSKIFVVGGTGAQGMPIIRSLVVDKKYSVLFLTRDANSSRAQELLSLGNVSALEGTFADEATLREGFRKCDGAFINIDGFNTGEKAEMYWAIRAYTVPYERNCVKEKTLKTIFPRLITDNSIRCNWKIKTEVFH